MSINLYWNNICLITKQEEAYISKKVKEKNITIDVEYFGLGRKKTMLQEFKEMNQEGYNTGDIIVSTDTDIFHDVSYENLYEEFIPHSPTWLRNDKITNSLKDPKGIFIPFITIPLVLIYNEKALSLENLPKPESFKDLFNECYQGKYTFGGPNNSAGKSLVKSLLYTYGEDQTTDFINHSMIQSMPAAAFRMVMTGKIPIAIVPTIFSLRGGINNITMKWPKDGAIPIPSYVAIKSTISNDIKNMLYKELLGEEFQTQLVTKAVILPSHKNVSYPKFNDVYDYKLMQPSWEYLRSINHDKLYALLKP